jgi:hypothetical protein
MVGKRAREFPDLKFVQFSPTLAALVFGDSYGFSSGDDSEDDDLAVAYWLRKSVTIPAQPFLQPAAEEATSDAAISEGLRAAFGDAAPLVRADRAFGWKVEQ